MNPFTAYFWKTLYTNAEPCFILPMVLISFLVIVVVIRWIEDKIREEKIP